MPSTRFFTVFYPQNAFEIEYLWPLTSQIALQFRSQMTKIRVPANVGLKLSKFKAIQFTEFITELRQQAKLYHCLK